jgi:hypothetical protein
VFPDLANYNDPMASAMTPIISAYWDEAGQTQRERIGLDPDAWQVTDPNTRGMIERAAFDFCEATNATTSRALGDALAALRREMIEGIVAQGDTPIELTRRVQSVFDAAEEWRAWRIAVTEASRAVHSAELESARQSGVVAGFEWLISGDACPLCQKVAAEAPRVRLGEAFAVVGDHPTYSTVRHPPLHPGCQCSVTEVLTPEYGGPADPQWASTLIQPRAGEDYTPPSGAPSPRPAPEARRPISTDPIREAVVAAETEQRAANRRAAERQGVHVERDDSRPELYRREIRRIEKQIAEVKQAAIDSREAYEKLKAERQKAIDKAWDWTLSKATRAKWEKRLRDDIGPRWERLRDTVEWAPDRVKAITKLLDSYRNRLASAQAGSLRAINYKQLQERFPNLIPPGPIADRIKAYKLGDAKLDAIARIGADTDAERARITAQMTQRGKTIADGLKAQADLVSRPERDRPGDCRACQAQQGTSCDEQANEPANYGDCRHGRSACGQDRVGSGGIRW